MLDRNQYDKFRVAPNDPATLRAAEVERILNRLAESSAGRLKVEKFDVSLEGRPIHLATLGTGPRRILLWSQMHGDEPTHTAVMLDLFSYLLQSPDQPLAADILDGATLLFIPMLNPDGAEAVIRFNAQGIDINRDWRRQATPEGRALMRAAKTLNAQFGFNLHNQNARTSIGRPPLPAAISVLAPAPDATRTVPPSMRVAKQMCTCFVEAVRPFARGMISRYDDTYEPRAFGDGIQSLGISTMLVEAGGWTDADIEPLTRLHFHGMLNTLHAIATDKYRQADPQIYEDLPESNSARMNDCFIAKANVLDAKVREPFVADLVFDQSHSDRLAVTARRDGKIIDIGDLPGVSAKSTINAAEWLIVPGQFAMVRDWLPGTPLSERRTAELLARGATTIIGMIDLSDHDLVEAMAATQPLPMNWSFVGNADSLEKLQPNEALKRLALATANGLTAVVSSGADESLWQQVNQFGLPLIKPRQLPETPSANYREAASQVWNVANALNQQARRGRINRDYFVDVLFFDLPSDPTQPIDWQKLRRVMVAGETVWENGKRIGGSPGVQLRRR